MPWPNLNERAQYLLRLLVERYIADGVPVGSRTLSRASELHLSPATIRNVMADLEEMGLICAPHTSAGRVPTELGYRLFVNGLLVVRPQEVPGVASIEEALLRDGGSQPQALAEAASNLLSGLTRYAGVVTLPRPVRARLRQLEFIALGERRVLAILVTDDGAVQNRILVTPRVYSQSELSRYANYLGERLGGADLSEVRARMLDEMRRVRDGIEHELADAVRLADEALRTQEEGEPGVVVAGQTNLLGLEDLPDIERIKRLFEAFNEKRELLGLLDQCERAEGVQIFIGSESGSATFEECSLITAPYSVEGQVVGVLGVVGPKRMPYDKIIQVVDVTARLMGSALKSR
jgi:heat-inducible transcriptional repressor